MPYEFTEWPYEPEPEPAGQMGRHPPGKRIGTDVLEPRQPSSASRRLFRFFAIVVAVASVIALAACLYRLLILK